MRLEIAKVPIGCPVARAVPETNPILLIERPGRRRRESDRSAIGIFGNRFHAAREIHAENRVNTIATLTSARTLNAVADKGGRQFWDLRTIRGEIVRAFKGRIEKRAPSFLLARGGSRGDEQREHDAP
jgi:hypothetical protein